MAAKKKVKQKEQFYFEHIHSSFTRNLESLKVFVSNVAPIAEKQDRATTRKLNKVVKQISEIVGSEIKRGKRKQAAEKGVIDKDKMRKLTELAVSLPRLPLPQAGILYRSSFVMLISYFDFLLSDIIRSYYRKYPESLSVKELALTLSELKLLDNIDDAIDFLINKEVEDVLYRNLQRQKLYLRDTLKIDTKDDIINWNRIIEAIERRNIIVHNESRINRRYLANIDLSQIPEKSTELKEGMEIKVSEKYFDSVFEEICVSGLILLQTCWRKWEKARSTRADQLLILDIYDVLTKEDWMCAERLGLFSKECEVKNQAYRITLDINYCQSLKWQGKKQGLEEELKKFDVSALSPKFALAVCALKSDRDSFYGTIENAVIVDDMSEKDFWEWPLFRELRKDPEYGDRITSVFKSISEKQKG